MYTKQEISKQKQAFWTAFGQYMRPVLSAEGLPVNWVNYKTGVAGINFRMDADNTHASISIVLSQKDKHVQKARYGQFMQLKNILREATAEEWLWQPAIKDEHRKDICSIGKILSPVNISNTADWPTLISFFKPRIIALDAFWNEMKYGFEV